MRKLRAGKAGMVDACTVRKEKREARDQRYGQIEDQEKIAFYPASPHSHGDPVDEIGDLIALGSLP